MNDVAKPMKNPPVVDAEGRIIFCTQGRLLALVEQDSRPEIVWEYMTGSHVPGPIVLSDDGTLRFHTGDGLLHCLSDDGKQAWAPAFVGEPLGWAAPVVDVEGNTYVSAYDGGIFRIDAEGRLGERPFFRSRRKFDSAGVILDDVLFIGAEDGYLFAIALEGERGKNIFNQAAEQGYTGGFVNSSPAIADDGTLVVASRSETLFGFRPEGETAWSTPMPGQMLGSPVIDPSGHVYVGVSQSARGRQGKGFLVCIDGNSHKIRWQYEAVGPVESTPVIGDDQIVYVGDNSGTIHAVNNRGSAEWTAQFESPVRSAGTILSPQRLAFGLDDDVLVVLECSSTSLAEGIWPKIGG